jgi:hypothetical protein
LATAFLFAISVAAASGQVNPASNIHKSSNDQSANQTVAAASAAVAAGVASHLIRKRSL